MSNVRLKPDYRGRNKVISSRGLQLGAPLFASLLAACQPQSPAVPEASNMENLGQRSELCSAANVVGVGLQAEYFAQPGWHGKPTLVRTDGSIDFVGLSDLPNADRAALPRSIRWSGWVKAPTTGVYRFHIHPAQAEVKISRGDVKAASTSPEPLSLTAGRFYPITVEIDHVEIGQLPVRLEWTTPHGARYVIPRALLNLPSESAAKPTQS